VWVRMGLMKFFCKLLQFVETDIQTLNLPFPGQLEALRARFFKRKNFRYSCFLAKFACFLRSLEWFLNSPSTLL
jgi:hypothetical protein